MKITFTTNTELEGTTVIKTAWDLHVSGDADDNIQFDINELIDAVAQKIESSSTSRMSKPDITNLGGL